MKVMKYFWPYASISRQQISECMISNIVELLLAPFSDLLVCLPLMHSTQVSKWVNSKVLSTRSFTNLLILSMHDFSFQATSENWSNLLYVSLLFTGETPGCLLNVSLGRYLGLVFVLLLILQKCTLTQFHYQSPFLLKTHGPQFIDWPLIVMHVIGDFERSILFRESVQNIVHKERLRHLNLESQPLGSSTEPLYLSFSWCAHTHLSH